MDSTERTVLVLPGHCVGVYRGLLSVSYRCSFTPRSGKIGALNPACSRISVSPVSAQVSDL